MCEADNLLEIVTAVGVGGEMPTLALTTISFVPEEDPALLFPAANGFVHD